jgi:hypothetical protein
MSTDPNPILVLLGVAVADVPLLAVHDAYPRNQFNTDMRLAPFTMQ